MSNVTGDEYEALAARVAALEAEIRLLRARDAENRGEFDRIHTELADIREHIAELGAALLELRERVAALESQVREIREVQRDHTALLLAHSARLDEHYEFHVSHAAGLASLTETVRENGDLLREILRRLDAA